ncbi:JAB domain-containing protein [Castellaniella sp.]|uniref:JAB domain-containing protein n=1 Tax=Castellaniella sp. TaxID=1955812 RepID=UPI002AFE86C7|nr:JAB domain-containing protein [Castellaniella sp.]
MNEVQDLYVRNNEGGYQVASDAQILAAGRNAANSLLASGPPMEQPKAVKEFFQAKLTGLGHECAAMLFLDAQMRLIKYVELAHGTLSTASVFPREIVKTALCLNAAACIMSHNHPSGIPEPSRADLALTAQLKQALSLVDVRLLDHVIVSATDAVSLAERGQC